MEKWKNIDISGSNYQVSNLGRIKSSSRKIRYVHRNGKEYFRLAKEKILKKTMNKSGYEYVSLREDNKIKTLIVHRLVAKCFVKNENNKPQVNHIDGNKLNNKASNLEWVTEKENMEHASKNNLMRSKENHYKTFFKKEDILYIRNSKKTNKALGEEFKVDYRLIWQIRKFITWKRS